MAFFPPPRERALSVYEVAYRLAWEQRPSDEDLAWWFVHFAKGLRDGLADADETCPHAAEVRDLRP